MGIFLPSPVMRFDCFIRQKSKYLHGTGMSLLWEEQKGIWAVSRIGRL